MTPKEVAFDAADIQRLVQVVPAEAVLVGGQALAYWAQYFGVAETSGPAISLDADFIGTGPTLVALASGMHGKAQWQSKRAISALIGCIAVPKGANQFLNIDVLKDLFGLDANKVATRSIAVDMAKNSRLSVLSMYSTWLNVTRKSRYLSTTDWISSPRWTSLRP